MAETENLMDAMFKEMARVRQLIADYKSLPAGVGMIGAGLMTVNIKMAEKAISNNDVVEMLVQYEKLKSCE